MHIPSYHDHSPLREDRSMTPMIDVVFLLLIFFVCASAGQIRESILKTELAAGGVSSNEVIERDTWLTEVWLRLKRSPEQEQTTVNMNDRDFDSMDELQPQLEALAKAAPEIPVILDIEPQVPLGDMIDVFDTCKAAGFESINFAADPANANAAD